MHGAFLDAGKIERMETQPTTPPVADEVAAAAARACATDPEIQALLTRKATGAKLTPQEYGKLGQWKSRQNKTLAPGAVTPKEPVTNLPPKSPATVGSAPTTIPVQFETEACGQPLSPGDASYVSRTVGALVTKANNIGGRHVATTAREIQQLAKDAGLPAPPIDKFSAAVVFSEDDRAILTETAPAVCEAFNVNPKSVPVGTFFGTLGLAALDFIGAVGELNKLKDWITEERKKLEAARAAKPDATPKP